MTFESEMLKRCAKIWLSSKHELGYLPKLIRITSKFGAVDSNLESLLGNDGNQWKFPHRGALLVR